MPHLKLYVHILLSMLFGMIWQYGHATHIVGGEVNYRCLGGSEYEITVTVFRDCDTGVPWFDNPASVGIFNQSDSLIFDLRIPLRNNDTLSLDLSDPCLVAPPNVCIHTTTYTDTIQLPFLAGGYQIVYQRCCRNQDIVNIANPTSTGATYSCFVSESALLNCNTSVVFNQWPPVYICQGVPIVYDHSGFDPDGDSIVYKLCTPLTGASPSQSMPQPPNNPPYSTVSWIPPYSVDNMLGGPDSLRIDPQTGLLTGTPDVLGVFVVGICAEEYRQGQLISTTRRDFQYVVGTCGRKVSAAFFAPTVQCDNSLIVQFQNNSLSLGVGYVWSFGDTLNSSTSTATNPTYIYPDTGEYTITLIADPGSLCADTLQRTISLQFESLDASFSLSNQSCSDTLQVAGVDLSTDSLSTISSWSWSINGQVVSYLEEPNFLFDSSDTYTIGLTVMSENGCQAYFEDTLVLTLPSIEYPDSLVVCPGDSFIFINPGADTSHQYLWSPANLVNDAQSPNPYVLQAIDQTFQVTVTSSTAFDTCQFTANVEMKIAPTITIDLPIDTLTCEDTICLDANVIGASDISWSLYPDFNSLLSSQTSICVPVATFLKLYIKAENEWGCSLIDSVMIIKEQTNPTASFSFQTLGCGSSQTIQFIDQSSSNTGSDLVMWLWDFGNGDTSTAMNPTGVFQFVDSGFVSLTVMTANGCSSTFLDTLLLNIASPFINDSMGICPGESGVFLNPKGDTSWSYQWSPAQSLSNAQVANPFASPTAHTIYTVTVTSVSYNDTCQIIDSIEVILADPILLNTESSVLYCDSVVRLSVSSPQSIVQFDWSNNAQPNLIIATGDSVQIVPSSFPFASYSVTATDQFGCQASRSILVEQITSPVTADFDWVLGPCADSVSLQMINLTQDTFLNPIQSYEWQLNDGQMSNSFNPLFYIQSSQQLSMALHVELENGCRGIIQKSVPIFVNGINGDTILYVCPDQSQIVLNEGGDTNHIYQWFSSAILSSSDTSSPVAIISDDTTTFIVQTTGINGQDTCISVQQIQVIKESDLIIQVPKDTVVCTSIFFVDSYFENAARVDWSFSPTFSPIAISNVSDFYIGLPPAPFDLIMYVRAESPNGCIAVDTLRILKRDIPINAAFQFSIDQCEDSLLVDFINTTTIPPNLTLSDWLWDLSNGQQATTQDIQALQYSPDSLIVTLTVNTVEGCQGTISDTLLINFPYFDNADSVGLCQSDSIALNPGGSPTLMYQWTPSIGLSADNIANPMASPDTNTTYQVQITAINDFDTCHISRDVFVSVDSFSIDVMDDTVICSNQITLQVTGNDIQQIDWSLNPAFTQIIGQQSPLTINLNDSRSIYVRVANSFGCVIEDSLMVHKRDKSIPLDVSFSIDECTDSIRLSAIAQSTDQSLLNWSWIVNGLEVDTDSTLSLASMDSLVGTLYVIASYNDFCSDSVPFSYQVYRPDLTLNTTDTALCTGSDIQLEVNSMQGAVYNWSPSDGLSNSTIASPVASIDSSIIYQIGVSSLNLINGDSLYCFVRDSIQIDVYPNIQPIVNGDTVYCAGAGLLIISNAINFTDFIWAYESTFDSVVSQADSFVFEEILSTWIYILLTDSFGCPQIDSVQMVNGSIVHNVSDTIFNCLYDSLFIETGIQDSFVLQYDWYLDGVPLNGMDVDTVVFPPGQSGELQLAYQTIYNCEDTLTIDIEMAPDFVYILPKDLIFCDSVIQFQLPGILNTPVVYNMEGTAIDPSQLGFYIDTLMSTETYYLQFTDSVGCAYTDSIDVDLDLFSAFLPGDTIICQGVDTLSIDISEDGIYEIVWTEDVTTIEQIDSITIIVAPQQTNNYSAIVRSQSGCTDTVETTVIFQTNPVLIDLQPSADTIFDGQSIQISTLFDTNYQYQWYVEGQLVNNNSSSIEYNLNQSGFVVLQVTDQRGCVGLDTAWIFYISTECDDQTVFTPNAFTPDGDGVNDHWQPFSNSLVAYTYRIYDRWGNCVYDSDQEPGGWNGVYKGQRLRPDVYGFVLLGTCIDGADYVKKGNITLIR